MHNGTSPTSGAMPGLLTPDAAAKLLNVSKATLAEWRCDGRGPIFVKIGGRVSYTEADLAAWIASRRMTTTSRAA